MFTFVRFGLRGLSVAAASVLAGVFGLLCAWTITRTMLASDQEEAGNLAAGSARVAAAIVERNLVDATQQMILLRTLAEESGIERDPVRLRRWLDATQRAESGFSWIGLADLRGQVVAGSDGLAEGADVNHREWFRGGLQGIHVGDLHAAMLLQKALPPCPTESRGASSTFRCPCAAPTDVPLACWGATCPGRGCGRACRLGKPPCPTKAASGCSAPTTAPAWATTPR